MSNLMFQTLLHLRLEREKSYLTNLPFKSNVWEIDDGTVQIKPYGQGDLAIMVNYKEAKTYEELDFDEMDAELKLKYRFKEGLVYDIMPKSCLTFDGPICFIAKDGFIKFRRFVADEMRERCMYNVDTKTDEFLLGNIKKEIDEFGCVIEEDGITITGLPEKFEDLTREQIKKLGWGANEKLYLPKVTKWKKGLCQYPKSIEEKQEKAKSLQEQLNEIEWLCEFETSAASATTVAATDDAVTE